MSEVFISYSRRDSQVVDKIVQTLHEAGVDAWIDREDIQAGNSWRLQIVEAIDACTLFVLALSPNSAISDNVRKEIDLAQDSGRVIVPIMLEPVKIPSAIRYQLAGLQFLDVSVIGFEKAMEQLLELARREISKKQPPPQVKTAELVIQGVNLASFDEQKQKQLLDFIASLTQTGAAQLRLQNLAAGSVHAFVQMPARAAYQLKTLALNQDARFKQMGISLLRLEGGKNFIEIASGNFLPAKPAKPKPKFGKGLAALFLFLLLFAALAIFVLPQAFTFTPQPLKQTHTPTVQNPPAQPATGTPDLSAESSTSASETPTKTPAPPTYTFTPEVSPYAQRCSVYEDMEINLVALQWLSGMPLNFYFRMPGGVPGLEREIEGDDLPWVYSVNIDGHVTEKCEFLPGYKERLYCSVDMPSSYSYTLQPITLSVNGCEQPIYENPITEIPKMKLQSPSSSGACSDSLKSSDYSAWCICMGGVVSRFGACVIP